MNTYLAIITTALVLTQIIRVTQNTIQLKKYGVTERKNTEIFNMWKKIERVVDIYLEKEEEK